VYRPELWGVPLGPAGIGRAGPSGSGDNSGAAFYRPQQYTGICRRYDKSHRHRRVCVLLLGMVASESTQASGRRRQCLDTSHS